MGLYLFYTLMMSLAFQGLLGAILGVFKFATSRSTPPRLYTGRHARVWGSIYFGGLSIIPFILMLSEITQSTNTELTILLYIVSTILAFTIALISRKYGVYTVS